MPGLLPAPCPGLNPPILTISEKSLTICLLAAAGFVGRKSASRGFGNFGAPAAPLVRRQARRIENLRRELIALGRSPCAMTAPALDPR